MKGLTRIYRRCTSRLAKKPSLHLHFLWAITVPTGFVSIVWICAMTAHQMDSGRLVIDIDVKENVRIRADIDKRSGDVSNGSVFEQEN